MSQEKDATAEVSVACTPAKESLHVQSEPSAEAHRKASRICVKTVGCCYLPRMTQSFLALPTEIRLSVYSKIIPAACFDVNLCAQPEADPDPNNKPSPLSTLLQQTLRINHLARDNGIHLLEISKDIGREVLPMLQALLVRFHCSKCYEEFLRNLSYGLGSLTRWMRQVQIYLNFDHLRIRDPFLRRSRSPLTEELAKTLAREAMSRARKFTWLFYGRMDLLNKELWYYRPAYDSEIKAQEVDTIPAVAASQSAIVSVTSQPVLPFLEHVTVDHWVICAQLGVDQNPPDF